MELLRIGSLLAGTVAVGMMAGVYFTYAVAVMPGLKATDDRTFVAAFQHIDRAIINPVFVAIFLSAPVLTALAGVLTALVGVPDPGAAGSRGLPWIFVAFGLNLVAFLVTIRVNLPLNDAIKAAGDPDQIDVTAARARFQESTWARWNVLRTALTLAAFGCLMWALVIAERHPG